MRRNETLKSIKDKNIKNTDIYIDNLMQKRYICVKVGKKRIITEVYTNADDI